MCIMQLKVVYMFYYIILIIHLINIVTGVLSMELQNNSWISNDTCKICMSNNIPSRKPHNLRCIISLKV